MDKIDLSDVTFIIPVRADSPERLENFNIVMNFLIEHFITTIFVIEGDKIEKAGVPENVKKWFIPDEDLVFYRTRYLNKMTRESTTPIIAIWDADVLCDPLQIAESARLLREGKTDMVYPYFHYFYSLTEGLKEYFQRNGESLSILEEAKDHLATMSGNWSIGGAFLVNREAYIEAGMENENFYGWGPEDVERYVRWINLGYRVERVEGALFHLPHPVGLTSTFASEAIEIQNRKEFLKVCSMSKLQLKNYTAMSNIGA
jgi:hypothetical protein